LPADEVAVGERGSRYAFSVQERAVVAAQVPKLPRPVCRMTYLSVESRCPRIVAYDDAVRRIPTDPHDVARGFVDARKPSDTGRRTDDGGTAAAFLAGGGRSLCSRLPRRLRRGWRREIEFETSRIGGFTESNRGGRGDPHLADPVPVHPSSVLALGVHEIPLAVTPRLDACVNPRHVRIQYNEVAAGIATDLDHESRGPGELATVYD
jgi:hypothetical protein